MTPKEKAQELFDKICQTISGDCEHESYCEESDCKWKGTVMCKVNQNEAKHCALIAVNNTIEALQEYDNDIEGHLQKVCPDFYSCQLQNMDWDIRYWYQVKTEIKNL